MDESEIIKVVGSIEFSYNNVSYSRFINQISATEFEFGLGDIDPTFEQWSAYEDYFAFRVSMTGEILLAQGRRRTREKQNQGFGVWGEWSSWSNVTIVANNVVVIGGISIKGSTFHPYSSTIKWYDLGKGTKVGYDLYNGNTITVVDIASLYTETTPYDLKLIRHSDYLNGNGLANNKNIFAKDLHFGPGFKTNLHQYLIIDGDRAVYVDGMGFGHELKLHNGYKEVTYINDNFRLYRNNSNQWEMIERDNGATKLIFELLTLDTWRLKQIGDIILTYGYNDRLSDVINSGGIPISIQQYVSNDGVEDDGIVPIYCGQEYRTFIRFDGSNFNKVSFDNKYGISDHRLEFVVSPFLTVTNSGDTIGNIFSISDSYKHNDSTVTGYKIKYKSGNLMLEDTIEPNPGQYYTRVINSANPHNNEINYTFGENIVSSWNNFGDAKYQLSDKFGGKGNLFVADIKRRAKNFLRGDMLGDVVPNIDNSKSLILKANEVVGDSFLVSGLCEFKEVTTQASTNQIVCIATYTDGSTDRFVLIFDRMTKLKTKIFKVGGFKISNTKTLNTLEFRCEGVNVTFSKLKLSSGKWYRRVVARGGGSWDSNGNVIIDEGYEQVINATISDGSDYETYEKIDPITGLTTKSTIRNYFTKNIVNDVDSVYDANGNLIQQSSSNGIVLNNIINPLNNKVFEKSISSNNEKIILERNFYSENGFLSNNSGCYSLTSQLDGVFERQSSYYISRLDEVGYGANNLELVNGTNQAQFLDNRRKIVFSYDHPDHYTLMTRKYSDKLESQIDSSPTISHEYTYIAPLLSGVKTSNGTNFQIDYNGDILSRISVNGQNHVEYEQDAFLLDNGTNYEKEYVVTAVKKYGNGYQVRHLEDKSTGQVYLQDLDSDGNWHTQMLYTPQASENQDTLFLYPTSTSNTEIGNKRITFDESGEVCQIEYRDIISVVEKNKRGQIIKNTCNEFVNEFVYNGVESDKLFGMLMSEKVATVLNNQLNVDYTYDNFNRITKYSVSGLMNGAGSNEINLNPGSNRTTGIFNQKHGGTSYKYNDDGLISEAASDLCTSEYEYDDLGKLTRQKSIFGTSEYTYDSNGNILQVIQNGTALKYTYDETNPDQMINVQTLDADGNIVENPTIVYDKIGNPMFFRNNLCIWKFGRKLVKFEGIDIVYDADGSRLKKGDTDYRYDASSRLYDEVRKDSNTTIRYLYNSMGLMGFVFNNVVCHYLKNAQGDITHILDLNGDVAARYEYDAWGRHKVFDSNGVENTSPTFVGNINPFRYRGYYYDADMGLYYLNSRYYDPEIGRFINADDVSVMMLSQLDTIDGGLNLYAYCLNNPVMYTDPSGYSILLAILVIALIGAAAGGLIGLGVAAIKGTNLLGGFLGGAISGFAMAGLYGLGGFVIAGMETFSLGAFLGGLGVSAGVGSVSGMLSYSVEAGLNNSWNSKDFWKSALIGSLEGVANYGFGAIMQVTFGTFDVYENSNFNLKKYKYPNEMNYGYPHNPPPSVVKTFIGSFVPIGGKVGLIEFAFNVVTTAIDWWVN